MCLAWAPASSPSLVLSPPRSPDTAPFPHSPDGAGYAAAPPPRRAWHTRPLRMARAAPPRARPRSSRALALDDSACALFAQVGFTALMLASARGREGCVRLLLEAEAIEVNAKVSLEHALPQHMRWIRFHVLIPLLASRLSLEQQRSDSIAYRGNQRLPRDRQAPPRRGRRSDASKQYRQDGHRLRTGGWQERGRGAPQRASVRRAHAHRLPSAAERMCRGAVLGARGPRVFGRSANEWRPIVMG